MLLTLQAVVRNKTGTPGTAVPDNAEPLELAEEVPLNMEAVVELPNMEEVQELVNAAVRTSFHRTFPIQVPNTTQLLR